MNEEEKIKLVSKIGQRVVFTDGSGRTGVVRQITKGGISQDCPNGEVLCGIYVFGEPTNRTVYQWAKNLTPEDKPR